MESAGGTCNDTLTAVDTRSISELALECSSDMCVETTVVSADNAYALNVSTCSYATAAKNALGVIADNRNRGIIDCRLCLDTLVVVLVYAVVLTELLKLAGCGTYAREALLIVVRKKKLEVHLSGCDDLRCVCKDRHTLSARIYASSYHAVRSAALGYLNETQTACADLIDILKIAKCGDLYLCSSCCFKNSGAFFNGIVHAVNFNVNSFH